MKLTIDFLNSKGTYEIWNNDSLLSCFVIPRNSISAQFVTRVEADTKGTNYVYFLMDTNEAKNVKRKFYIGETTSLYNRLTSHKSTRKWWNQAVVFTGERRKVDEACINALERLLIEKYEGSGKYDLDNSEGSQARITEEYKNKLDYILLILDYLGYSCESDEEEKPSTEKEIEKSFMLEDQINASIYKMNKAICSDQMKLYKTYYSNENGSKAGLCAIWPKNNGSWFEAELYLDYEKSKDKFSFIYDITSRARGNRKSAMKVRSAKDINNLLFVLSSMLHLEDKNDPDEKRPAFSFSMLGLKKGDQLNYIDDHSIACVVEDERHVLYQGRLYSLTKLATILKKPKNKISGSLYFEYKGERLDKLRKRLED